MIQKHLKYGIIYGRTLKKIIIVSNFLIIFSSNVFGEWSEFSIGISEGVETTLYINEEEISIIDGFIHYYILLDFSNPVKFDKTFFGTNGYFFSAKTKIQGDCDNNKLKILKFILFEKPMNQGKKYIERLDYNWIYPSPETSYQEILSLVCEKN